VCGAPPRPGRWRPEGWPSMTSLPEGPPGPPDPSPRAVVQQTRRRRVTAIIFAAVAACLALWLRPRDPDPDWLRNAVLLVLFLGGCMAVLGYVAADFIMELRKPRTLATALLVVAAFLLFARAAEWRAEHMPSPARGGPLGGSPSEDEIMAQFAAADMIKDQLKCPSTAEVHCTAKATGGFEYQVVGYADAENSFGARKRVQFVCTMVRGAGGWRMQDLVSYESP